MDLLFKATITYYIKTITSNNRFLLHMINVIMKQALPYDRNNNSNLLKMGFYSNDFQKFFLDESLCDCNQIRAN